MEKWGISALLNLRIEWDDRWMNIHAPHYLWLPAIDGTPPVYEQLVRGAQFIQTQVEAGRSIYVHCAAGLGRGPTMVTAYLVAQGLSVGEAIAFIPRAARSSASQSNSAPACWSLKRGCGAWAYRSKRCGVSRPIIAAGKPLSGRASHPGERADDEI